MEQVREEKEAAKVGEGEIAKEQTMEGGSGTNRAR